jgi:hypothetical protein
VRRLKPALNANEVGDNVAFRRTSSGTHGPESSVACTSAVERIRPGLFKPKGKLESERENGDWIMFFVHMEARKSTTITV